MNTIDEYYATTSDSITFITQDVYHDCEDSDSDINLEDCMLTSSSYFVTQDEYIASGITNDSRSHVIITTDSDSAYRKAFKNSIPLNVINNKKPIFDITEHNETKLIKSLTDIELNHLIEQFTVITVNTVSDNPDPETYNTLYNLLKIKDDPISLDHPKLDMYCFPSLFSYGIGGRRNEKEEQAQPLRYEKTLLMTSNAQFRRNCSYLFYSLQEHERRKVNQGLFASVNNIHGLSNISSGELLQMLKSNDNSTNRLLSRVLSKLPNTPQYWAGHKARLEAQIDKFGPPTLFVTFSPAEYDWVEAYEYVKQHTAQFRFSKY